VQALLWANLSQLDPLSKFDRGLLAAGWKVTASFQLLLLTASLVEL
jgi:hypothetical protein